MAEQLTPEREAKIRAHLARQQRAGDLTFGDYATRDLLAEVDRLRSQLGMHLTAWRNARRRAAVWRATAGQIHADLTRWRTAFHRMEADRGRLAEQVQRVRDLHREVCGGACGLTDGCECAYGDCVCEECGATYPCATRRALDEPAPAEPGVFEDPAVRDAIRRTIRRIDDHA